MDTVLFSGLLVYLADNGALDRDYIAAHTSGFDSALARAREIAPNVRATAAAAGLAPSDVAAFFALFAGSPRTVTCYSQGVNQSAQGTDKVNAIINYHLATGRIGKPGMGPFSLTGQPNAMGGREVGGLANQLAAHMNFVPGDISLARRFWKAPRMAEREGLKAVAMFEAIGRGEIKALWIMGTNPAMSLPNAGGVRGALKKLELFVLSENVLANDTVNAGPHILLPAAAWGEKDGTVTNSERRISRQRAFLPLPGEATPDWWMVSQVATRLGHAAAFAYRSAADIFREHAALSASRTKAAAPSILARSPASRTTSTTRSIPCSGRCRQMGRPSQTAGSSPKAGSSRPTARRASSQRKRPPYAAPAPTTSPSPSTPVVSATSGTA